MSSSSSSSTLSLKPSDFFFGRCLGEGSYARVVHAKLKSNDNQFAVKIMEKRHIQKEGKIKSVMMEKEILSKLSHPFVVQLCFSFQDADYLYIGLELVPGGELASYVNECRKDNEVRGFRDTGCSLVFSRFCAAELVEGLEYLHQSGILHRDFKPENVLITAKGHIKIADFGTAFNSGSSNEVGMEFVGTAEYVSPEVLRGDAEGASRGSDLWALGCVIYFMAFGKTPFHGATEYLTFQYITAYCNGERSLDIPKIDESLSGILEALMKPEANKRLGAGGIGNDYRVLKENPFFIGSEWGELHSQTAPYIPPKSKMPSCDNMRDGSSDEWLEEGEPTPILGQNIFQFGSYRDESRVASDDAGASNNINMGEGNVDNDNKWQRFLGPGEKQLFTGEVWKRRGLFSRRRQLILTDKPRLLYVDPEQLVFKGEIPWTDLHPVTCVSVNSVSFDVEAQITGRKYHLTSYDADSCTLWISLINAALGNLLQHHLCIFLFR